MGQERKKLKKEERDEEGYILLVGISAFGKFLPGDAELRHGRG